MIVVFSNHISNIKKLVNDMIEERKRVNIIVDSYEKALMYESKVKPYLNEIRHHIDKLELIVDNDLKISRIIFYTLKPSTRLKFLCVDSNNFSDILHYSLLFHIFADKNDDNGNISFI